MANEKTHKLFQSSKETISFCMYWVKEDNTRILVG